jgi:hypothetical protein
MRHALHLGVQKAIGVVGSHYQVDFAVMALGYVVPIDVEDVVAMERADALAATAAGTPKTSWTSCSPTLLTPASLRPEDHWAPSPFLFEC